jgi:hypothetical protein
VCLSGKRVTRRRDGGLFATRHHPNGMFAQETVAWSAACLISHAASIVAPLRSTRTPKDAVCGVFPPFSARVSLIGANYAACSHNMQIEYSCIDDE